ncbi:unnamed protein product [Ilex paraguariensis]|uniref:Uncharacterized protein n=1 Tax=Ilex paraguariensis TaxID=185542 RepID=A0ABC8TN56_9AQUA
MEKVGQVQLDDLGLVKDVKKYSNDKGPGVSVDPKGNPKKSYPKTNGEGVRALSKASAKPTAHKGSKGSGDGTIQIEQPKEQKGVEASQQSGSVEGRTDLEDEEALILSNERGGDIDDACFKVDEVRFGEDIYSDLREPADDPDGEDLES